MFNNYLYMEKKYISLTFDDGPTVGITDRVLDILEEYGAKASFFLIGDQVTKETEYLVKRAHSMGCSIENHSKTHGFMTEQSVEQIKDEIEYTTDKIIELTGEEPKFFRPPYIVYDQKMYDNIDLVFISGYGYEDWVPEVDAATRIERILEMARPGQICLLHDMKDNEATVEAIKVVIPMLQEQGYEFVNIRELFEKMNTIPARNVTYMCTDEVRKNYE